MGARGFTIRDLLEEQNVCLITPAFTRKLRLTNEQVTHTRRIANVRIHTDEQSGVLRCTGSSLKLRLFILFLKSTKYKESVQHFCEGSLFLEHIHHILHNQHD